MSQRLAALIVNYDSAPFALALARELRAQWSALGAPADALELVLVDNASTRDPAGALAALAAAGVRVLPSRENLGYGAGMNLALAQSSGSAGDLVLVVNPDLAPFPGALARLLDTARSRPELGALGPRTFLDPARTWLAPPNRLPTPESELAEARALHEPEALAAFSAARTRHALRQWTAADPMEVEMLSGACLLLSRASIEAAGGLFDARYPLYFEDTDLFRRLARHGRPLLFEPRAEIVHHWARSSGIEAADPEPGRRQRIARDAYFERWFGADSRAALREADELRGRPARELEARFTPLGPCSSPPELELPGAGRRLLELALAPHFPLAAGTFAEGRTWRMDPRAYEWFFRGRYFLRAPDPDGGRCSGAWSFDKSSLSRTAPLDSRELASQPGARR